METFNVEVKIRDLEAVDQSFFQGPVLRVKQVARSTEAATILILKFEVSLLIPAVQKARLQENATKGLAASLPA